MQTQPIAGFANFGITLVIACVLGGLVGYVLSYMTLRLKEEWFLALVLLVGGEILRITVRGYSPIICASNGVAAVAQPFSFMEASLARSVAFMLLALALALLAYLYAERLTRSPFGRLLKAIRENDRVAQALGKDTARIRAQVMMIGSAMAAVSGVLFAVNIGFVSTNDYVVALTLDIWVMIVLGGMGNHRGALLGVLIITVLDRATSITAVQLSMSNIDVEFNYIRYILFGVILLLMLRYRPQGILPEKPQTTDAGDLL
jgi:branched-chain amino acid transport system permease protein